MARQSRVWRKQWLVPVTFYRTEGAEHSEFATFSSVCRLPEELFSESPNLEFRRLKAVEIPT